MNEIVAVTGHRPDKLGGYGDDVLDRLIRFATAYFTADRPEALISGMALGWDTACAIAAVDLSVPLIAAVPFEGQERTWPKSSRALYRDLLGQAAEVKIVSEGGFAGHKMHARNRWMVDSAERLTALWSGAPGGTAGCVSYADKVGRPVVNLWDRYVAFLASFR